MFNGNEPVLSVSQVSHQIEGCQILHRIDLRVSAGEIHGVVGPNGAGKSTLFGLISGEYPLQNGDIQWHGQSVGHLPMWKRVRLDMGYLPQRSLGFDSISVLQNVMMIPSVQEKTVLEALEQMGLLGIHLQSLGTLSGGERRRLDIVRLILLNSKIWVLDEPFAALDWESISLMQSCILAAKERGVAVLLTDHACQEYHCVTV